MKILFHVPSNTLKTYPENNEPIIGLSPEFEVYELISEAAPSFDASTQYIVPTQTIDSTNKQVVNSWQIKTMPTYNYETEKIFFDTNTKEYTVVSKTKQEILQDKISEGFIVMPENFTLALGDVDRAAFSQMLSLVKEAIDLGLINNDDPQIIADANGLKHTITTLRFRQIMVQYGMYYKTLWDNF